MLKVFGHLNPDTDSVCSALIYAWFLNQQGQEATPYILSQPNKEALYVLERFGFPIPEELFTLNQDEEVVIVDTNNPGELPESLSNAKIVEIIDHHKLSGLSTPEPLTLTIRPVACTATVIWRVMQEKGWTIIPENVAGLMLAAILSDTLKFTSPTTTETDKAVADKLTELAKVEIEELAAAMFAAKSDLSGMNAKDILLSDSKLFTMGDKKIRVSSLETTNTASALALESEVLTAIEGLKQEESLDGLFFFIVDILNSNSTLVLASDFEKQTASRAFASQVEDSTMLLPGVVSRKKQIVPPLEKALS